MALVITGAKGKVGLPPAALEEAVTDFLLMGQVATEPLGLFAFTT